MQALAMLDSMKTHAEMKHTKFKRIVYSLKYFTEEQ